MVVYLTALNFNHFYFIFLFFEVSIYILLDDLVWVLDLIRIAAIWLWTFRKRRWIRLILWINMILLWRVLWLFFLIYLVLFTYFPLLLFLYFMSFECLKILKVLHTQRLDFIGLELLNQFLLFSRLQLDHYILRLQISMNNIASLMQIDQSK